MRITWQKKDYAQVISEPDDRKVFFNTCAENGFSGLLDNPFDGFYLAAEIRDETASSSVASRMS